MKLRCTFRKEQLNQLNQIVEHIKYYPNPILFLDDSIKANSFIEPILHF